MPYLKVGGAGGVWYSLPNLDAHLLDCTMSEVSNWLLDDDALRQITSFLEPIDLVRFGGVSAGWRSIAGEAMGGVAFAELAGLPRNCNQGTLCAETGITPVEARRLPHKKVETRNLSRTRGYYDTHVFRLPAILSMLVRDLGGWAGLKTRLDGVAAEKREWADLECRIRDYARDHILINECPLILA